MAYLLTIIALSAGTTIIAVPITISVNAVNLTDYTG